MTAKMASGTIASNVILSEVKTSARPQRPMMGKINISAFGLAVGALGQYLLLGNLFDRVPQWLLFAPLLGPWLLLYVISFCRVAPCGPGRFAQLLIIAISWYSVNEVMSELVWLLAPTSRSRVYSAILPHVLSFGSALVFIPLTRAIRWARDCQANEPNLPKNTT